jgi:competence ComEA-like helix-hairpin-helix protein
MKAQFVGVLHLWLLVLPIAAMADSELPDGKGKDAVENTCTECHSLERIQAQRLNEEGWTNIVREMVENGASINPDDVKVIVDYLTKNFGPDKKVNINKAAVSEIATVLQLSSAEADTIVQYRTRHGHFKDLSELEKVSGLADKIEAKKTLIEF